MAYRDRTPLFLRYRAEARALHSRPITAAHPHDHADYDDKSGAQLLPLPDTRSADGDVAAAHAALTEDVRTARTLLSELRASYAAHLLPRFGEDGGAGSLETRVRSAAHALTACLHAAQTRVRSLRTDDPVRANLQRRFAAELAALSADARARQSDYLDQLQRQRDALGDTPRVGVGAFALDDAFDDEDGTAAAQLAIAADASAADIQRREEQLRDVASSVTELATLVNDLASLVVDQGTILDRIDYNLDSTRETTHSAVRELRIADTHQRKRQAFCVIVMLAIACGIMMIILVLRWTA